MLTQAPTIVDNAALRRQEQVADRQVLYSAGAEKKVEDGFWQTLEKNHPAMAELSTAKPIKQSNPGYADLRPLMLPSFAS